MFKRTSLKETGFEVVDNVLSNSEISVLSSDLKHIQENHRPVNFGGIRNIEKKSSAVFELIESDKLQKLLSFYFSVKPQLVRAIYFNKTAKQNWLVSWHQDKTVAVSNKFEQQGWGRWSIKDGSHHVQPPLGLLSQMITVRLHLDESNEGNGCLKIIPNSHHRGILSNREIKDVVVTEEAFVCNVQQGSALVMRPHLLHSSSKGTNPSNRRTLHLEFSAYKLPLGVQWA